MIADALVEARHHGQLHGHLQVDLLARVTLEDLLHELPLEVLERHAYTIEFTLSYTLRDDRTGALDPSAMIRVVRTAPSRTR